MLTRLPLPNPRHMEWYRRGKTAFLHFTVNTFTDREWGDGTESPAVFAPGELDCRQWARVLRDGGFTAAILTAKHHDGFCLWPSAYTEHSVKNSPDGRDVVKEFTDACREFGIKPGIYISPWDRNNPTWGKAGYNDLFAGQLTELMTNYGPIWECWWDGAGSTEARYDWARWAGIVRTLQPQCVIFGCLGAAEYVDVRWVGNEEGRAGEDCWATVESETIRKEICADLNSGTPEGSRFIPAETNVSIRPGWFYHASQDDQVLDREQLVDYWFRSAGRNTAILLNLPPDRRGLIHEKDARAVKEWNRRMEEIFRDNLAKRGTFTGPGGGEILLESRESTVPLPQGEELRIDFAEKTSFDCFRLEEEIELGHRIRGFSLEALADGSWMEVSRGRAVGFCRSSRFAPVTAEAVRLRILEAVDVPRIRYFGLFRGAAPEKATSGHFPEQPPVASVTRKEHLLEIALEGIYPYNRVELSAALPGNWQVLAFNGTRYETVGQGSGSSCSFPTQTGSYRLQLKSDSPFPEDLLATVRFDGKK